MDTHNKSGFLSAYGFACGYTEVRETDTISLRMWKEHGIYHVQHNRFDLPYARRKDCKGWESFESLSIAKKYFFDMCDKLNMKRIKS